jgi:hypothetical protein
MGKVGVGVGRGIGGKGDLGEGVGILGISGGQVREGVVGCDVRGRGRGLGADGVHIR